jgi:hypothetical protein
MGEFDQIVYSAPDDPLPVSRRSPAGAGENAAAAW